MFHTVPRTKKAHLARNCSYFISPQALNHPGQFLGWQNVVHHFLSIGTPPQMLSHVEKVVTKVHKLVIKRLLYIYGQSRIYVLNLGMLYCYSFVLNFMVGGIQRKCGLFRYDQLWILFTIFSFLCCWKDVERFLWYFYLRLAVSDVTEKLQFCLLFSVSTFQYALLTAQAKRNYRNNIFISFLQLRKFSYNWVMSWFIDSRSPSVKKCEWMTIIFRYP